MVRGLIGGYIEVLDNLEVERLQLVSKRRKVEEVLGNVEHLSIISGDHHILRCSDSRLKGMVVGTLVDYLGELDVRIAEIESNFVVVEIEGVDGNE